MEERRYKQRDRRDAFASRFAAGISALPDYAAEASPYVSAFRFEVNHDALDPEG